MCWPQKVHRGHFDAYSVLSNVTFEGRTPSSDKVEFCTVQDHTVGVKAFEANKFTRQWNYFLHDVMLQDVTGDFDPQNLHRPGFIILNNVSMTTFCPEADLLEGSCAKFSPGKCWWSLMSGFIANEYFYDIILRATDLATVANSINNPCYYCYLQTFVPIIIMRMHSPQ
jgi:hypothetical protein